MAQQQNVHNESSSLSIASEVVVAESRDYVELQEEIQILQQSNNDKTKEINLLNTKISSLESKCLSQQHEIKRINNAFEHSMNQLRAAAEHNATAVQMINNLQKQNDDLYAQLGTAQTEINILAQAMSHYYYKNENLKETKNKNKIESNNKSILGYIEAIENTLNILLDEKEKKINNVGGINIRGFDIFNKEKWAISRDGHIIKGVDDIGMGAWLIYAKCYNKNGYNEGIHVWSIKCVSGSIDCRYKGIGVISDRNMDWTTYECDKWGAIGYGSCYSYYDGIWKDGEIITALLDCDNWNVKYYKDCKEVKVQKIKPNKSYYFAFSSFGYRDYGICYECVATPDLGKLDSLRQI